MPKTIFFDTETTGNTENDFLCQIAYKTDEEEFTALYKPEIKIPPEASAVHHITNKMVADKPSFKDSGDREKIKKLFEDNNSVVVAHNAPFDLMIIKKENILPLRFICTLRVARHLDPEEKIDRYNLQYLRYLLEIEIDATAHDALGDVLVLEQLFERLKNKVMEAKRQNASEALEEMIEISSHPSLFRSFKFGKHNGKQIEEVARIDRGYLEWLLTQKLDGDEIDEDWIYTLRHFLGK
ncbi:MAG TPA: exonuclease domain-containing protein [Candidatus Paceibacterota bacterium]